jgi:hypothetical protein
VLQALRDELTTRAEQIFSEIRRVLGGAYIEDFDNPIQHLKTQWVFAGGQGLEACYNNSRKRQTGRYIVTD